MSGSTAGSSGAAAAGAPAAGAPATGGGGAGGSSAGAGGSAAGAGGSTAGTGGTGGGSAGSGGKGGSGGGSGGSGGGGTGISFATDIYPILSTKCTPCHTKATPDGQLGMSSASAAYTSLLGNAMPPTGAAAKTDTSCTMLDSKKLRVSPGDADHSYLYIKINNADSALMAAQCGPGMPETASGLTLSADQKMKIHDWIAGGAKP
jgi:hypothetical protein